MTAGGTHPPESLPARAGPPPRTNPTMPHQQLDQNAPAPLQEQLLALVRGLAGVSVRPSLVSVPGARAFVLDDALETGPPEAFMAGREFAHLHPEYDGSLHLALPPGFVGEVEAGGWGELHPAARMGLVPRTAVMVYGPRDEAELGVVWAILRASYAFARGEAGG